MEYSKVLLEDIMTDAKHGLSLREISIRLGISCEIFTKDYYDNTTDVKKYYDSGRSLGKIETDKTLYELAKNGSTAAKQAYDEKLKEAEFDNIFFLINNEL